VSSSFPRGYPTLGVLAGWQYYWTATPLSYLNPIYRGIRQAAADLGCNLLLGCGMGASATSSDPLRPAWPVLSPESDFVPIGPWNTAGIIAINPLHTAARSRDLKDLLADGHPVIFVAGGESGPTIMADNTAGIRAAMQHLVWHGHRRIAFISGSAEDLAGDTGERLRAYRDALGEFGLTVDERIIAYGRHIAAGGQAAMREIMATGAAFTAVLASNDESALGAMQALKEGGIRVPQDVALVGFDDRPESAVQRPALTSVAVPLFEMGYRAVEQTLRQIQGEPPPREPIKVATRLVPRASCGCGRSVRVGEDAAQHNGLRRRPSLKAASSPPANTATEPEEIRALLQRLTEAFTASVERNDPSALGDAVDAMLWQAAQGWDDAAIWEAAFAIVSDELPMLAERWPEGAQRDLARGLLEETRDVIAVSTWQRHRQYVVNQRWIADRVGVLTAHLQDALDETQIYDVLARHLPEMGIQFAAVALFESTNDDPTAYCQVRTITPSGQAPLRHPGRDFPPAELLPADRPFSLALVPLADPRGQLGFVAFDTRQLDLYGAIVQQLAGALNTAQLYREATEGRRLAEEASQMKSRFLSTVSHELRTPLNLIVGLGEILLRDDDRNDAPLPPAARQDIERLNANAQHLGRLINDVLDLASSDAGRLRLNHQFVDLADTLGMVTETGRRLAADKGLAWRALLPKSGPWVWGDRTRLSQVALNLISNAIKFTARGEVGLTVESDPLSGSVTVSVRDTGLGIPPEEQGTIFDDFRRSERSIARGYGGLGLGLAICRRLIELHGGTIGVRSTGQEGAGSTFYFTLPIVQPPAAEAPVTAYKAANEQGVLVLTTSQGTSVRLREHLHQRGFEVQVGRIDQPSSWQSLLMTSLPAAVVLDVTLGSDQAWSVLKVLKASPATQGIPTLFYTLSQDRGAVLELDYLTKPIELAELTRALDQHWLLPDAGHAQAAFLVVDDDADTLEMHARIVQAHSVAHRVFKARNGLEALAILHRERVDLVLLDLMMPEMDGFAVLEAMREREATRDIPVIVVTGQTLTESEMARLNLGVTRVLSKGVFNLEETLVHLDAALARKRELSSEAQRLVRQAMAYIQEHYADPISRQDLADHVGLSDDYLTSCFHKELGLTPVAYLNRYRVQQARHLLKNTHKSITEIAFEVGFSGSSYFSRIFHRETGMTPAAYRRA
jgi:signal transduction histidine kinase/DNA-binding LacI/PurR family transcriptional regulator/AraC-like DNA-binding protein